MSLCNIWIPTCLLLGLLGSKWLDSSLLDSPIVHAVLRILIVESKLCFNFGKLLQTCGAISKRIPSEYIEYSISCIEYTHRFIVLRCHSLNQVKIIFTSIITAIYVRKLGHIFIKMKPHISNVVLKYR